jgi:alpha-L-fucosidase 2
MEKTPAARFEDAYLLGNGRLGASVYGGVPIEEILLNDDTLWSGQERFAGNPRHYDSMREARALALAGEVKRANDIINNEMEGIWGQTYLPLASLFITVGQENDRRTMRLKRVLELGDDPYESYERTLSLDEAVARVSYVRGGIRYTRESFISYPKQVAVVKLTASGGPLHIAMALDSKLRHTQGARLCAASSEAAGHSSASLEATGMEATGMESIGNEIRLQGIAPDHAEPSYTTVKPMLVYHDEADSDAIRFAACACVADTDGEIVCDSTRVYVRAASYAVVLIAAGTNYEGYKKPRNRDAGAVLEKQRALLTKAATTPHAQPHTDTPGAAGQSGGLYETLLAEHIADYQSLYGRAYLMLGDDITGDLPTSERLSMNASHTDDPSLSALALQYARYLTIAGSRAGFVTQALNLQGIWNDMVNPPWASNYTTNINLEMNYWPTEALALPECHQPLLELIEQTADSGRRTAREYYHAQGWVAHHNIDLWRLTEPSCEDASWSWWPFGGVWLAQHLWTHYEYTQDVDFLSRAYPTLRDAARFILDFLVEHDGEWLTAPSISPENKFIINGRDTYRSMISQVNPGNRFSPNSPSIAAVTKGSAMDMTMVRELFRNVRASAEILGIDEELLPLFESILPKLTPYKVGRTGALQEWYEDYEECTPGMGHVSHLYGVYPADILNEQDYPQAYAAAEQSLYRRVLHGGMTAGWPGAWALCLAARFRNRLLCGQITRSIGGHLSANLLTKGSTQIDCIFGWGAGVMEALLQSHRGVIALLPSPSYSWREGCFTGFRARGGFAVNAAWKDCLVYEASIVSLSGKRCRVQAQGLRRVMLEDGTTLDASNGEAAFDTRIGGTYTLLFS